MTDGALLLLTVAEGQGFCGSPPTWLTNLWPKGECPTFMPSVPGWEALAGPGPREDCRR